MAHMLPVLVPMDPLRRHCAGVNMRPSSDFPVGYWFGLVSQRMHRPDMRQTICAFCAARRAAPKHEQLMVLDQLPTNIACEGPFNFARAMGDRVMWAPFSVRVCDWSNHTSFVVAHADWGRGDGEGTVTAPTQAIFNVSIDLDNERWRANHAFTIESFVINDRLVATAPDTYITDKRTSISAYAPEGERFRFVAQRGSTDPMVLHICVQLHQRLATQGEKVNKTHGASYARLMHKQDMVRGRVSNARDEDKAYTTTTRDQFVAVGKPVRFTIHIACFQDDRAIGVDNERAELYAKGYDYWATALADQKHVLVDQLAQVRETEHKIETAKRHIAAILAGRPLIGSLPLYQEPVRPPAVFTQLCADARAEDMARRHNSGV